MFRRWLEKFFWIVIKTIVNFKQIDHFSNYATAFVCLNNQR